MVLSYDLEYQTPSSLMAPYLISSVYVNITPPYFNLFPSVIPNRMPSKLVEDTLVYFS